MKPASNGGFFSCHAAHEKRCKKRAGVAGIRARATGQDKEDLVHSPGCCCPVKKVGRRRHT